MPGRSEEAVDAIAAAVEDGHLSEADLDRAAASVLGLRAWVAERAEPFDVDAHHRLAREAAASCAVLLKNDESVLPLSTDARIAVIGQFARTPRYQGAGSSHINATRIDAALDSIRSLAGNVEFAAGFALDGTGDAVQLRDEAVGVAGASDVAVVFAGLPDAAESEGFDRAELSLPDDQIAVINAVAEVAPRTVVVLSHGGVVTMEEWHEQVDAVLDCFLLGQAGGSATADLLFGVANPSGHLAESVPLELRHTTSFLNFPGDHLEVRYGEGVFVGYRGYETTGAPVRYPFGHGLSYTTFETSRLRVDATGAATAAVRVTVANTGPCAGRHVVQLYVGSDAGPVHRPVRELRAFRSVWLEPEETREVEFDLDDRAFSYWDVTDHAWVVPAGDYRIEIGASAHDVVAAQTVSLTVTHRCARCRARHRSTSGSIIRSSAGRSWWRHSVGTSRRIRVRSSAATRRFFGSWGRWRPRRRCGCSASPTRCRPWTSWSLDRPAPRVERCRAAGLSGAPVVREVGAAWAGQQDAGWTPDATCCRDR